MQYNKYVKYLYERMRQVIAFIIRNKKYSIILSIIMLVALAVVVGSLMIDKKIAPTSPELIVTETAKENARDIGNITSSKSTDEEVKSVTDELARLISVSKTDEVKQVYQRRLVEVLLNRKKYDEAMDVAKQHQSIKPTLTVMDYIAYIYMKQEKYKEAADYYQEGYNLCVETEGEGMPCSEILEDKKKAEALMK